MDPRTRTELAVLGLLAWSGESSGYELHTRAGRSVGFIWAPARSQLYSILPRLVDAGLVTSRGVTQAKRPDKQLYKLTSAGKAALRAWVNERQPPEPDRNPLLLQLFFGYHGDPEALLEHVRARRHELEQLEAELREIERTAVPSKVDAYHRLTRRYGLAYARALARWARETERELEALM
jgi:DNA-binding PadR family transcriptional regulator